MNNKLCLAVALTVSVLLLNGCQKVQARMEIRDGNKAYQTEDYKAALTHYTKARQIDPNSFPELSRMIGYSRIGLYVPDDKSPANEKNAELAIAELRNYLRQRPDDQIAREALINLYLNSNRRTDAINFFSEYLEKNPGDLATVRSIAQLYAQQGDFNQALNWFERMTRLDNRNPEAFYTFGVVCYEKVSKNPPADPAERLAIIEKGRVALERAIKMRPDYAEAMAYVNLLYRQQALVETDPAIQQELLAKADAIRNQAIDINRKRKAAAESPQKAD